MAVVHLLVNPDHTLKEVLALPINKKGGKPNDERSSCTVLERHTKDALPNHGLTILYPF